MAAAANPVSADNDDVESPFAGLPRIGNYYLLHEEDGVQFVLRKIDFIRQTLFKLKDHQFSMSAIVARGGPKLIASCMSGVEASIRVALEHLRDHYNEKNLEAEERERCYITIVQDKLETGIQVGNFHLHVEDLGHIAAIAAKRLYEFVMSHTYYEHGNSGIQMDDTFQIRFQIISEPHVNSRARRRANLPDPQPLPGISRMPTVKRTYSPTRYSDEPVEGKRRKKDQDKVAKKRSCEFNWMTETPTFCKGFPGAFLGKCLLVTLALGKLFNEGYAHNKGDKGRPRTIRAFFQRPRQIMTPRMGELVNDEIEAIYKVRPELKKKPNFLGDCRVIADILKSQIYIYSSDTPSKLVALYPSKPNLTLPPIFLYRTRPAGASSSHVSLIKDIVMFYNNRGFSCLSSSCTKLPTTAYKVSRHKCKVKATRSCFVCHRILLKEDTYTNLKIMGLFCDSELTNRRIYDLPSCLGCGLNIYSEDCRRAHSLTFCNQKGFTCGKCKKFNAVIRTNATLKSHVCTDLKPCEYCRESKLPGKYHICHWSLPRTFTDLDNMGFIHLSFAAFESETDGMVGLQAVALSILFEDGRRCEFSRNTIFDSRLKRANGSEAPHCFKFNYFPDNMASDSDLNRKRALNRFQQPILATNTGFDENLLELKAKSDKTVLEEFICLVMCERFRNFTFVTSEARAMNFIVRAMVANNLLTRRITVRGTQVSCLTVAYFSIRFICINKFLQGNAASFKRQFGLTTEQVFVPRIPDAYIVLPLVDLNFTSDKAPEFEHYENVMDSKETRLAKRRYWCSIKDKQFDFASSVELASDAELEICATAALQFLKVSLQFQQECSSFFGRPPHLKAESLSLIPAFKFGSITSYVMHTFRTFVLTQLSQEDSFYSVIGQYGSRIAVSLGELQATEYLRFKQPFRWQTQFSHSYGQKKFFRLGEKHPFAIADGYDKTSKTCFFFHGCYWHGHNCKKTIKDKWSDIKKAAKAEKMRVKFEKFKMVARTLLELCKDEVTSCSVLWECEFEKLSAEHAPLPAIAETDEEPVASGSSSQQAAKSSPSATTSDSKDHCYDDSLQSPFSELKISRELQAEYHNFIKGRTMRPLEGMVIRDAFKAALCETYALKYVKSDGDGLSCLVADISSLYPYIGIKFLMPCGPYQKLIGDQFQQSDFVFKASPESVADSKADYKGLYPLMEYKNKPVIAIVHCRVFPPRDLLHPFLHTTVRSTNIGTLCLKCAEEALPEKEDPNRRSTAELLCSHSELERSFVGTFTSSELSYAHSLGYTFHFFELIVYSNFTDVLKPFLTLLGFQKLKFCQYPKHVKTDAEKLEYCQDINERMDFKNIINQQLTPSIITPNEEQRSFYKACLNYFLGSFGTNVENYNRIEYLECYEDVIQYMKKGLLKHMEPMSNNIMQVLLKSKEVRPSRSSCVTISCMITSLARVVVHQHIQKLQEINAQVLRVSTDALYFVMKETQEMPFPISEAFGCFKSVYNDVHGVLQMGVKNLSVLYKDEEGYLREHFVTSGISLHNESRLSHKDYAEAVDELMKGNVSKFTIEQVRCENSLKKKIILQQSRQHAVFNANLFKRRMILANSPTFQTVPFGFNAILPTV